MKHLMKHLTKHLRFRCQVCGEIIEMKKDVKPPFSDWGYDTCVEWSDFRSEVPALSESRWERSSSTPIVGGKRRIFVKKPFDERVGDAFWVKFEPALLFFDGWDDVPEEEIRKCAMVRCRFEKILVSDAYCAWIEVSILQVIPLHELFRHFDAQSVTKPLDCFEGLQRAPETHFRNDRWHVVGWSAQGDCGETRWIYTDETGTEHLVLALSFGFDEEVLYMGNLVLGENE